MTARYGSRRNGHGGGDLRAIQSLGGVNMARRAYRGLRKVCDDAGRPIFDEVQTGLGGRGRSFADGGREADMIRWPKARERDSVRAVVIAPRWAGGEAERPGTTFGGRPVAMAAMKATLELIDEGLVENARQAGSGRRRTDGDGGAKSVKG